MNWRNKATGSQYGIDVSSWKAITGAGNDLMKSCVNGESRSGGDIATTSRKSHSYPSAIDLSTHIVTFHHSIAGFINPQLILFLWATGAPFEKKLIEYENNPVDVIP